MTCSARSFSDESSRSTSPSVGSVVPAIGTRLARPSSQRDEPLGRRADERDPVEVEQEEVRRRVDAAQRAVDVERRRRGRPLGPLRGDDLEGVARDDVLLRAAHHLLVALAVGERRSGPAVPRRSRRARDVARSSSARDLVGVAGEHLGEPGAVVEADERLGDDEAALGEAVARRPAAAPSARASRRGRRRGSRRPAGRAPSASSKVDEPRAAPIHEFRPSRPRSTDSSRKLARPAARSRR